MTWEAIYQGERVAEALSQSVALNASIAEDRGSFSVPEKASVSAAPTPEEVSASQTKWGMKS